MQIGESFKRFGVAEDSTNLLVGRFDATPEQVIYLRIPIGVR